MSRSLATGPSASGSEPLARRTRSSLASWVIPLGLLVVATALAARFVGGLHFSSRVAGTDVAEQPLQGGVFRFPLTDYLQTLDPAAARFTLEVMLVQQVYDGLTGFDEHLNIVPALARLWEISADGRTYTFELREDARFHNGRTVTAEDCVFSFERLVSPELNTATYQYYSRIEGVDAFRSGKADHVAGLRALDERTFQIEFTSPFVPALSVLSMYSSKILPKKELEEGGEDFFLHPIGTGAFQFARWIEPAEDPGIPSYNGLRQGLRLDANPGYFAGRPHLDAVVFRAVWDDPSYAGQPPVLNEVADCFETLEWEGYADWVEVEANRLLALNYIFFPNDVAPYNDARIRRAINYAINKRSFLDTNRRTAGIPTATGIIPPGIPGFIPSGAPYYTHDVDKARELLARAGFPGGKGLPPLVITTYGDEGFRPDRPSVGRRGCVTSCLAQIGVKVKTVQVDSVIRDSDPRFKGQAVLESGGWFADFPDPDNFLRPLFHSDGPMNNFAYENSEVDRLLDQVWSETSYTTRTELYHRIEKIILRDSPIIPTDYGRVRFLVRANVRGFTLTPLGTAYIRFKDVWFAADETSEDVEL